MQANNNGRNGVKGKKTVSTQTSAEEFLQLLLQDPFYTGSGSYSKKPPVCQILSIKSISEEEFQNSSLLDQTETKKKTVKKGQGSVSVKSKALNRWLQTIRNPSERNVSCAICSEDVLDEDGPHGGQGGVQLNVENVLLAHLKTIHGGITLLDYFYQFVWRNDVNERPQFDTAHDCYRCLLCQKVSAPTEVSFACDSLKDIKKHLWKIHKRPAPTSFSIHFVDDGESVVERLSRCKVCLTLVNPADLYKHVSTEHTISLPDYLKFLLKKDHLQWQHGLLGPRRDYVLHPQSPAIEAAKSFSQETVNSGILYSQPAEPIVMKFSMKKTKNRKRSVSQSESPEWKIASSTVTINAERQSDKSHSKRPRTGSNSNNNTSTKSGAKKTNNHRQSSSASSSRLTVSCQMCLGEFSKDSFEGHVVTRHGVQVKTYYTIFSETLPA